MITLIPVFILYSQKVFYVAGLSSGIFRDVDSDSVYSSQYYPNSGYHFGFTVEKMIGKNLAIQSGLLINTKGLGFLDKQNNYNINARYYLFYLDLPISGKFIHQISKNSMIFGTLGVFIGYGLSSSVIIRVKRDPSFKHKEYLTVKWGFNKEADDIKPIDYGLNSGIGFQFKNVLIGIIYDLGLANNALDRSNKRVTNTRVLKLTLAYRLR